MLPCVLAAIPCLGEIAIADARVDVGFLTCGVTQIRGEKTPEADRSPEQGDSELVCAFIPGGEKPEESYIGTFEIIGSARSLLPGHAMIWAVKAPAELAMTAGALEQVYAADNVLALPNAPPLAGQTNGAIVLQDITDARQVAAGAAGKIEGDNPLVILLSLKLRSASS